MILKHCYAIISLKEEVYIWKGMVEMKKILSAIAFVSIAMITGSIVSYAVNKTSPEAGDAAQENQTNVSCTVWGCTETEEHQHGLCGIGGCTLTGEHSHDICSVTGCTETAPHMHNGAYCYPHTADDGHGYHSCGVSGCTDISSHTHTSCGVSGCTQTGEHSHGGNGHHSGHRGGHH